METLETIFSRRSIRAFTDEPVPDELLHQVLRAGAASASGGNVQAWGFVLVRRAERVAALRSLAPGIIGQPTAIIAICLDRERARRLGGAGSEQFMWLDIGLATLRRDGWVSLDAGDEWGYVLSKPFIQPQGRLRVNASLLEDPKGELVAGFVDTDGKAVPGCESSLPLREGGLALAPRFERDEDELAGREVRLKLSLRRGKLYSYWFE